MGGACRVGLREEHVGVGPAGGACGMLWERSVVWDCGKGM